MGTRHLIAVVKNGDYKVAQYGQFDGYPSARGVEMLDFLNDKAKVEQLRTRVDNCVFVDEASEMQEHHHRNHSVQVLETIINSTETVGLFDNSDFAKDGLFCEWAYIIDFDTNTFEVYEGFKTEPVSGRFGPGEPNDSGYYPVAEIAKYPLDRLPTKAELLALDASEG